MAVNLFRALLISVPQKLHGNALYHIAFAQLSLLRKGTLHLIHPGSQRHQNCQSPDILLRAWRIVERRFRRLHQTFCKPPDLRLIAFPEMIAGQNLRQALLFHI